MNMTEEGHVQDTSVSIIFLDKNILNNMWQNINIK